MPRLFAPDLKAWKLTLVLPMQLLSAFGSIHPSLRMKHPRGSGNCSTDKADDEGAESPKRPRQERSCHTQERWWPEKLSVERLHELLKGKQSTRKTTSVRPKCGTRSTDGTNPPPKAFNYMKFLVCVDYLFWALVKSGNICGNIANVSRFQIIAIILLFIFSNDIMGCEQRKSYVYHYNKLPHNHRVALVLGTSNKTISRGQLCWTDSVKRMETADRVIFRLW